MNNVYNAICELLEKKEKIILATILEKSGSAPREQGTKMIIKKDFSIVGTIGGGLSEARTIKLSSKVFESGEFIVENFQMSNENASSQGIVCGGDVKVLLEYIDCNDNEMLNIYKKVAELKRKGCNFTVITKISEEQKNITGTDKWICTETGFYGEENDVVQCIFRKIRENFKMISFQNIIVGGNRYLIEPILNYENVYIIGAGHVSQKIAEITKMLDFKIKVLDDRKEFANVERFKTADEVKVISSFQNILKYIKVDRNSYVIIVTRGHAYDKEVLSQILKTDAKYIGMIGSKKKREFIYKCLLNEGYTLNDIERVHCPIGLSIFAQTPEEIAVSIVAELIKVKRCPLNEKK